MTLILWKERLKNNYMLDSCVFMGVCVTFQVTFILQFNCNTYTYISSAFEKKLKNWPVTFISKICSTEQKIDQHIDLYRPVA